MLSYALRFLALATVALTIIAAWDAISKMVPASGPAAPRDALVDPYTWDPDRRAAIEDRQRRRSAFVKILEATSVELLQRRIHLAAATDCLLTYCLGHYPEFLHGLTVPPGQGTLRERLALNLIENLDAHARTEEQRQALEDVRRELCRELATLATPYAQELLHFTSGG